MTNNDNTRPDLKANGPEPADRDWFGGRRWTGIAAVGVVILIAVCVAVIAISHNSNKTPAAAPPPVATSQAATSPGTTAASPPATPLPTQVPTEAPAGVTWTIYQTVALPSLPGTGPAKVNGAIATGYAHTPIGALLATANEVYRYALAPDNEWRNAAAAMLAPSAGTNAWLKVRAANPYGPGGGAGADQLSQIAAFQFVSYTPSDAVIQIVTRDSNGNLQVGADHVTWDGSDWRFVPGPDGGQAVNIQNIDNLSGFIEWRGV